jgi:ribonucleoside-diphosphate reductase alpha chain
MKSNEGYIKVVAMMQKYFDQAISGNWSYNPENYENNEVPISVMAQDLLTTYKYGWKTAYYQNTYDGKKDDDEETVVEETTKKFDNPPEYFGEDEACDACAI